jgi:hypothetical protein
MNASYLITRAKPLKGFIVELTFSDGLVAALDLSSFIADEAGPIFGPLSDPSYFRQLVADPELGTIVWPNGADLAPDVLHERALREVAPA